MNIKILSILVVIALLLGILGIILPKAIPAIIGGSVHNTQESFDEGIAVDQIERISGDGDVIAGGGVLALGKTASTSITAAQFCDNGLITLNPYDSGADEDAYSIGASLSLPTSAALIADCLPNVGDSKLVVFDNVASATARNFEFTTYNSAAGDYRLFPYGGTAFSSSDLEQQAVRAVHITGASVSYEVIEYTGN